MREEEKEEWVIFATYICGSSYLYDINNIVDFIEYGTNCVGTDDDDDDGGGGGDDDKDDINNVLI